MLFEMLLLFRDSDSEAAVEAEADLLSLAAALALSLELALWLLLSEAETDSLTDASSRTLPDETLSEPVSETALALGAVALTG